MVEVKKHVVVYSSDIHGNEIQYQKLVQYALQISADSVIVGGDIAPKGDSVTAYLRELKELSPDLFIAMQRLFFEKRLPDLISPLKGKGIDLFLMMGNDDCAANYGLFEKGEEEGLYKIIHGKRLRLTDDFDIVGYSYVPITPFGIKDWEKFDLSDVSSALNQDYDKRKKSNYNLVGSKSSKEGWSDFVFTLDMEKTDSIQKDLSTALFQQDPHKTVYVMHAPPNDTNLDIIINGNHVGSFAERLFIQERQPYLTLHGHIHETVYKSGSFKQVMGNTLSFASGNHNVGKDLAVVVFDLYDLRSAKRLII